MPFYEVTFETGRSSVANYENDEQALLACREHHRRAIAGEDGGQLPGIAAERVKTIRVYDKHPNDYNPEQTMSADVLEKEVKELVKSLKDENGVVDVARLSTAVGALTHPGVTEKSSPFDSNFKMQETKELALEEAE
jgi:hypothetical protein